jgi:BMFP domain-containing protein YqiC
MTKLNIQIDGEIREMTEEEIANLSLVTREAQELEAAIQARIEAKASALAKLAAIGLTEEEIAAL